MFVSKDYERRVLGSYSVDNLSINGEYRLRWQVIDGIEHWNIVCYLGIKESVALSVKFFEAVIVKKGLRLQVSEIYGLIIYMSQRVVFFPKEAFLSNRVNI